MKFFITLAKEIIKDDLLSLANALTYKLLLALFPFIIFMMTILGFLNIDSASILSRLEEPLPPQIYNTISLFVSEVFDERNLSLLSASLFVAVYSSSSGFRAVINGINKSYGTNDKRSPMKVGVISVGLVFLFAFAIAICFTALIFGENILALIDRYYGVSSLGYTLFAVLRSLGAMTALLISVCVIYMASSYKRVRFVSVLPGGAVTVIFWALSSKVFGIYISNFSRFSIVYGSLGSVFILMIWLNLLAFVLLVGSEINALLSVEP